MKAILRLCAAMAILGASVSRAADDQNPPQAARSVHLSYITPPAVAFYAEVTVEKSVPKSYFEVCGFNGGYFGIQELDHGKKVGIFSVWDTAKGDDPKAVADKDRVQTLFVGDGVRATRFGGEGTGGHSDFDFKWNVGDTCRFFLSLNISGSSTEYSAWIYEPEPKAWKHVATFAAPDGGKKLNGLYSFIEDFRRDTQSATEVRRARYSNQWIKTADGKWKPILKARFTASSASWEAKTTINAGVTGHDFFLQTGGDTRQDINLLSTITRPATDEKLPDLPDMSVIR